MMTSLLPAKPVLQPAVESERRERRFRLFDVEMRDAGEGTGGNYMTLTGYAAVFDSDSLPLYDWMYGEYVERIAPQAFDSSLQKIAAGRTAHLAIGHDMNQPLASTKAGNLSLFADEKGLRVVARLNPKNPYAQIASVLVGDGLMDEMSFAFTVARDQWIVEELADGTDRVQRTILEVDELFEASIVAQGAYSATDVGLRQKEVRSRIEGARSRGRLIRAGKVLSASNRAKVQEALDALQAVLDAADSERGRTASAKFTELRADVDSLEALVSMYQWGEWFIGLENAPEDGVDRVAMQGILAQLDSLILAEAQEPADPEPDADDGTGDTADGGDPQGVSFYGRDRRDGDQPSGGEPVAPGTQPVGEVEAETKRELERIRIRRVLAGLD